MEPLAMILVEWWWIGPAAAGAGALGWAGVRASRRRALPAGASTRDRAARAWAARPMSKGAAQRLELDAALLDLQSTRHAVVRGRADVKTAEAEVARAYAEQTAARAPAAAVTAARDRLTATQRDLRATVAEVRARRAAVRAAKAQLPAIRGGSVPLPVARVMAAHDAVLARWLAYETDPGLAIDYPLMSDPRSPLLAEFLRAHERAQGLRPASDRARIEPAEFLAYRDAVRRLTYAFDDAERRGRGTEPPRGESADAWSRVAADLADTAQRAFARSFESMGRAAARSWTERGRKKNGPDVP